MKCIKCGRNLGTQFCNVCGFDNKHIAKALNIAGLNDTLSFYHVGSGGSFDIVRDSGMFRVGTGDLIPGLDRGLVGAHLGERRLIIFTSKYGYGENAVGLVDENTALLFEVLVAAIKKD